jgi:hypothetical protein
MQTAINDYLKTDQAAGPVMAQAALLLRLNGVFRQSVPAPLGAAARVANLKAGKIIILAENGSVAVKLRQMAERLQTVFLAAKVECKGIEVKVQPAERLSESMGSTPKPLSEKACGSLQALLETLPENSPLRGGLTQFLRRVARVENAPDNQP